MLTRDQKNQNSLNLFFNNYFNVILVFILALILTAAYIAVIKPKYHETMSAIQSNIEQQQRLYLEQQKKLNNLKIVSTLYDKIPPADLAKFNDVLPSSYIKERLFGELEEVISENGFIVNSIELEKIDAVAETAAEATTEVAAEGTTKATSTASLGKIDLNLSLSVINYTNFKKLLRLLENNLRLLDITQVSFSPDGGAVDLTLSTYYYNKE